MIELLALIPILGLPAIASLYLNMVTKKYSKVACKKGVTGKGAAETLLKAGNIGNVVSIYPVKGELSDHYAYSYKAAGGKIGLSEVVFGKNTITAVGVAAHEVGHAMQHATKYKAMGLKNSLRPVANLGSSVGPLVIAGGLATQIPFLLDIGILCSGITFFIALITLPCEFDASKRGIAMLLENGVIEPDEKKAAQKVLKAAAFTYVAATLTKLGSLATLLLRKKKITQSKTQRQIKR
jgi:Zn-dependent membrane protease YugP